MSEPQVTCWHCPTCGRARSGAPHACAVPTGEPSVLPPATNPMAFSPDPEPIDLCDDVCLPVTESGEFLPVPVGDDRGLDDYAVLEARLERAESKLLALREHLARGFMTCVSCGPESKYEVVIGFRTLEAAQAMHGCLVRLGEQ